MRRRSTSRGRQGDHLVVCDRSGMTFWASETQKEWNGGLVHKQFWEARHPQDFVRGVRDDMRVDPARPTPDPEDLPRLGPATTHIALAGVPGNYFVVVDSISGFSAGNYIRIVMDDGSILQTQIVSAPVRVDSARITVDEFTLLVDCPQSIEISSRLLGTVAVGNVVINISNVISPTL